MRSKIPVLAILLCLGQQAANAEETFSTNDFIQTCDSSNPDGFCISKFDTANVVTNKLTSNGPNSRHCLPTIALPTDTSALDRLKRQIHIVVGWLEAHPQYGPQNAIESIGTALHTLYPYPCK